MVNRRFSKYIFFAAIILIQLPSQGGNYLSKHPGVESQKVIDICGFRSISESQLVCENLQRICGLRCYDPYTQSCLNNTIVCPSGHRACGIQCYDPLSQNCYSGGITGGLVCNSGEEACGYKCYNPSSQNCNGGRTVCAIGQRACGFRCFDSNAKCSTK